MILMFFANLLIFVEPSFLAVVLLKVLMLFAMLETMVFAGVLRLFEVWMHSSEKYSTLEPGATANVKSVVKRAVCMWRAI